MSNCRWNKEVEAWFDGESAEPQAVEQHIAGCRACAAHLASLKAARNGVRAVAERHTIADAQMPAFMRGIREEIQKPSRGHRALWVLASAATACMLALFSIYAVVTSGPNDSLRTEIQSYSTELEGATVQTRLAEDGTLLVWVSMPEGQNR